MGTKLFHIILLGAMCLGCTPRQAYFISTSTVRDDQGDYTIRWQIKPGMKGNVELFVSQIPNAYPRKPFAVVPISDDRYAFNCDNPNVLRYFMLVFDRQESAITSSRCITNSSETTFRDCGGYRTDIGPQTRWGMLYRSGALKGLSREDSARIQHLNIKSHIILSDDRVIEHPSYPECSINDCIIANRSVNFNGILQDIYHGRLLTKDIRILYEDLFESYAFDNRQQFHDALTFMTNPSHYPILFSDHLGKDRVAFLIMLVQSILNINKDDIVDEYISSNDHLKVSHLVPEGALCTQEVQEALTEFFRCRANDMNNIMINIEQRYGSIANYLTKELNFPPSEQEKIREILLEW